MFPLNPSQVCHVLRPRRNLFAKPLQRFGIVPAYLDVEDFHFMDISGFNSTAFLFVVYASCRHR